MEYKVCIKCEYKLPHSAKYCRMCGISLRDTDQNNVQTILSKETEILATSSVEANEQKIEMERNLIIKELNDEKTAQMQLQNYLLEQQFIQKETNDKAKEKELNEEKQKIIIAHNKELLRQKQLAELQELERLEQIKKIELAHIELLKTKEEETKKALLEIEAANDEIKKINEEKNKIEEKRDEESRRIALERTSTEAEIARINEEKIILEREKIEYEKKYEISQAKSRALKKIVIIAIFAIIAIAFIMFLVYKSPNQIPSQNSPPPVNPVVENSIESPSKPSESTTATDAKNKESAEPKESSKQVNADEANKDGQKIDSQETKKE